MDLTSINTAASSLKIAMELAGSLVGLRDFSKIETATSQLREALIAAQTALLVQNDTLFQLQREKFDTAEELRKLKETITQKERYTLLEISRGTFVYGMNVPHSRAGPSSQELRSLCITFASHASTTGDGSPFCNISPETGFALGSALCAMASSEISDPIRFDVTLGVSTSDSFICICLAFGFCFELATHIRRNRGAFFTRHRTPPACGLWGERRIRLGEVHVTAIAALQASLGFQAIYLRQPY
ncbi:hypothetical protein BCV75_06075 [Xylella fastidiosa]|nr:hypothetical protein BCV75_06075 [Xylella fastidiosa]